MLIESITGQSGPLQFDTTELSVVSKKSLLLRRIALRYSLYYHSDLHLLSKAGFQIYIEVEDEGQLILSKSCTQGSFGIKRSIKG